MLTVARVTKRYEPPPTWLRPLIRVAAAGPVEALSSVSLEVRRGQVVGLVGPNGAGKTTLIKIIAGLLAPTAGSATIDGYDTTRQTGPACRRLGLILDGDRGLYDRLTGQQNLEFFGVMVGLTPRQSAARARELLAMLELAHRDKLVFGYSAGMRMRLSICRALMAEPPLIVLDEPTRSLDPVASKQFSRLVRRLADEGHAVLLSNHRLDEVVSICSRIVLLVGGRVRFAGGPDALEAPDGPAAALSDLIEREASLR